MSVTIRYERHAVRNGVEGAIFTGQAYGRKIKRRKFISYQEIENVFKEYPELAEDPDTPLDGGYLSLTPREMMAALTKRRELLAARSAKAPARPEAPPAAPMMRFERHCERDGKPGGLFKGYGYRQTRSCLTGFWTYETIGKILSSDSPQARIPLGRWRVMKPGSDEKAVECFILTSEFAKALIRGFDAACHKAHREASVSDRSREIFRPFVFSGLEFNSDMQEWVALFENKFGDDRSRCITLAEIKAYLNNDISHSDPRRINFYLAAGQDGREPNLPGYELVKAFLAFENRKLPARDQAKFRFAHVSSHVNYPVARIS